MRSKFQDFGNTHFAEKPPFLRSSLVRRPMFVRRRANKQWPYRRATGPHAIPSLPLDKFLQLLVVVLAKLVTDGLYQIGQMDLVTPRIGHQVGHHAAWFLPTEVEVLKFCAADMRGKASELRTRACLLRPGRGVNGYILSLCRGSASWERSYC